MDPDELCTPPVASEVVRNGDRSSVLRPGVSPERNMIAIVSAIVAPTTTAVALPGAAGSRSAVNPRPKSVVQEICTLRSVGGGGR